VNLADILTRSAGSAPHQAAVSLGDRTLTYADLELASSRIAGLLAEKAIRPGDRVGIMLPNVPEFAAIYYGVLRAGGAVVPMNPLLKTREVEYYLADSGAKLIFAWQDMTGEAIEGAARAGVAHVGVDSALLAGLDYQAAITQVEVRDPHDTAVILYTSGTTGKPKGAELSHGNLTRNLEVVRNDLLSLTASDVVFGGLPLFHSFGQTVTLNATIAAGASLVLLQRFTPKAALELLADHKVTIFAGVPTMYSALLGVEDVPEPDALRYCVSGGAALPVEVLHRFEARFGCVVLEGYGLSETSPVASFNHAGQLRKPGSIGTPVTGVEMRVVDAAGGELPAGEVGEIAIRGHNVMKGYWNKPEATAEVLSSDGWFRTGDMGRQDEDGFFFIVDRKKDLIIRGGFNVYPREIEEVLYEHPAVAEAAVIGIEHPELGEEIAAAVALAPGAVATPDELRDHVKRQVAPYKYPRLVWIFDSLPKGPSNKIVKREIVPPAAHDTTGVQR
jgi:long-chain acyl-CoA synthetase